MGILINPSIINYRKPLIIAVFVNENMGLAINGDNGYVERQKHTITNAKDNTQNEIYNPTRNKNNDHYNIYPLYPLIIYVIDYIMFFGNNSWRYLWRYLSKPYATRGSMNVQ